MSLRTYTCPHCGANLMIEIGKKKAVCEYCDSEIYIDEIISDIKRDRNRDDRDDANRNNYQKSEHTGGTYSDSSNQGGYSGNSYENRTQSQTYASGYSGSQTSLPNVSPKSRMLALLFCIFLGMFGVHRFYVGKVGTGILYIFTFALFGFGYIFDIIMIVIGSFRDSRGLPLLNWEV